MNLICSELKLQEVRQTPSLLQRLQIEETGYSLLYRFLDDYEQRDVVDAPSTPTNLSTPASLSTPVHALAPVPLSGNLVADAQSTPVTPSTLVTPVNTPVKARVQSSLHTFFTVQASAASQATDSSTASPLSQSSQSSQSQSTTCASPISHSSQSSQSTQNSQGSEQEKKGSSLDEKRMPDAEIRERVKVCRRYDELKSYGNGEKRIAKLCSEFPFLSNANYVANLVKIRKARYKKFDLDIGNNKIQTSRRHKGRLVIMQRFPQQSHKKNNSLE